MLAKEDFTPTGADVPVFTLAPAVVYLAAVMTLLVVPFAPGLFGYDMDIGLLYFFAVGGLGVVGLMMAGWSSFNKYSLLGGLRAAAGLISYELPLILSVMGIVMITGTLNLNQIVRDQEGSFLDWFLFRQPLGALIFFIAATAEASRTPFDLTEADSEIVAGFATEYSGMRFGFFFFAEYVNMFILSAMTTVLFLGGWNAPFDIDPLLERAGRRDAREHRARSRQPGAGPAVDGAARAGRSSSASSRASSGCSSRPGASSPRSSSRSCCSTCW